jgi:hypothetical protein
MGAETDDFSDGNHAILLGFGLYGAAKTEVDNLSENAPL